MNPTDTQKIASKTGEFRPQLAFYHPNARCSGSAVKFELHPAHDNTSGCLMMSFANQISAASRTNQGSPSFARFDWEHRIVVKLDFADLSQMLMVLSGKVSSMGDQKGLFHRSPQAVTRILLRRIEEPVKGYSLDVYRTTNDHNENKAHIFLSDVEALGLLFAIEGSMSVIAFGIPRVIPHDTSAYRAQIKEMH